MARIKSSLLFPALLIGAALQLSACGTFGRLSHVGEVPALKPIEDPTQKKNYRPVRLPMPQPEKHVYQANSLWKAGSRAFFKDQRAAKVGDILTVNINVADSAKLDNTTTRTRNNSEDANLKNILGFETNLASAINPNLDPASLVKLGSDSTSSGAGKVDRKESISMTVAAIVTQVLPNGNLVIQGTQEVRVNFEVRELLITGIVRPEDISNTNTIEHSQIAEARISYGGRGQLSDVQQPRYGQQIYDILMPF